MKPKKSATQPATFKKRGKRLHLWTRPLFPDQIYRKQEGPAYFGLGPTVIDEKIKTGEIPAPMKLSDTGYAEGWLGQTIIDWQQSRLVKHRELEQQRAARKSA